MKRRRFLELALTVAGLAVMPFSALLRRRPSFGYSTQEIRNGVPANLLLEELASVKMPDGIKLKAFDPASVKITIGDIELDPKNYEVISHDRT